MAGDQYVSSRRSEQAFRYTDWPSMSYRNRKRPDRIRYWPPSTCTPWSFLIRYRRRRISCRRERGAWLDGGRSVRILSPQRPGLQVYRLALDVVPESKAPRPDTVLAAIDLHDIEG